MTFGFVAALRNAQAAEIGPAIGASGKLKIFSGTRPATGGAETTLLCECALSATSGTQTGGTGVFTFNAISNGTAVASGTPTWARLTKSDDAAVIDKQIEKLRDFDVIRFAQKANSNLAILRRMRDRGREPP